MIMLYTVLDPKPKTSLRTILGPEACSRFLAEKSIQNDDNTVTIDSLDMMKIPNQYFA